MDELFDRCVDILYWLADLSGMTYKEINIWIFVIIEPIVFVILIWVVLKQRNTIRKLKNKGN